jgi:DNA-nicking Smr family endonuclease
MAGKRKKPPKGAGATEAPDWSLPRAPEKLASPFKGALTGLKQQLAAAATAKDPKQGKPVVVRSAPPPPTRKQRGLAEDDATALSLAMQGVKPLGDERAGRVSATTPRVATRTARVAPFQGAAEDEARRRLDQLVAEDVHFRIERDQDYVSGLRSEAPARVVRELSRTKRASQTLDLHGMTQREARDAVSAFVRKAHRDGVHVLCIIHGKGHHSEGGQGVLQESVVEALTASAAALRVLAFVSAPESLGGRGALLVALKHA